MKTIPTLTFDDAQAMARAALMAARERDLSVTIVLVDAAGQILHLNRMDGARAYSADLAQRKARTAASVGFATAALAEALKGSPLGGEVLAVPGGVPVRVGAEIAGAIGVSGAKPEEDEAIAAAGLAVLDS